MKLVKCKIENFRSYENVEINFADLNVIIGKNDVGKSTILEALKFFFDENKASDNDINVYSERNNFSISCYFEVDSDERISLDLSERPQTLGSVEFV